MRIEYTELAIEDLTNILDTIAQDSPKRALAYVDRIKSAIELLQMFPNMGVSCRSKGIKENCRVMIFEAYLVFYTITYETVTIHTVIHTSQENY